MSSLTNSRYFKMFQKTCFFFIFTFYIITSTDCTRYNEKDRNIDELLKYVNEYINFTNHYTLNEDNSDAVKIIDSAVYDYGTFDFIVVGGGSAGSLLARRLSEVTGWKILLLEAGGVTDDFVDIPFTNLFTFNSPYNWGFKTTPQKNSCLGMKDHRCVYPTGKGLGGTAIIGHSLYARGNKADFDEIASMGLDGWSFDEVLPYFKKTEKIDLQSYDSEYHGTDGLMHINYSTPNPITYDHYLEAAKLAGLKYVDYNGENQIGISKLQYVINFNKKQTGSNTFILPILNDTPNLNLTTGAFVTKVLFNNDTATGVRFIKDGKTYTANVTKEVILSSGAIGSSQLLMLSGIGPKEDLEALDIEVVKDLPVGKNLTDHPVFVGLYIRTNLTAEAGNMSYFLQRWMDGLGYLTTTFNAGHIQFINTKTPGVEPPNIELLTANMPTSVPPPPFYNLNDTYAQVFSTFNTLTDFLVYTVVLRPRSRGDVKLSSNNPADFPLINPGFYTDSNDEDIKEMYEAIQFVKSLTESEPLRAINATIVSQAPDCEYLREESEEAFWYCAIKSLTSTLYQPCSTTKMGHDPTSSVVCKKLKVHGITNLRVVDYGSFPVMVRGHPIAAVQVLAERAADLIKIKYLDN